MIVQLTRLMIQIHITTFIRYCIILTNNRTVSVLVYDDTFKKSSSRYVNDIMSYTNEDQTSCDLTKGSFQYLTISQHLLNVHPSIYSGSF